MKKASSKKINNNNFYKKKVDYFEKTINSEGKLQELKEKSHFIELNANFTKFFGIPPPLLKKINGVERGIFFLCINCLQYGNDIFFTDLRRQNYYKNIQTLKNGLSGLIKKGLIIKTDLRGLYKMNHKICFKGDAKAFKKLLGLDENNSIGKNYKL